MAEPLSVAASIVGLIAVTVKVSKVLSDICSKTFRAPKECRNLRDDVNNVHGILSQLQMLVTGQDQLPKSRTSLIMVDQIIGTLASCVRVFSELHLFVEKLEMERRTGILSQLRWVMKEKEMKAMRDCLQTNISLLGFMVVILTWQVSSYEF